MPAQSQRPLSHTHRGPSARDLRHEHWIGLLLLGAADWLAGRQPEDDDVPMENMVVDDPVPTPSSVPSSLMHCTMTIGEAYAQYMDMVRQMREEQFWEAQADAAYNHHLLQEHLQAEEQIAAERAEQEALLDSYHSACKGRLEH